MQRKLRKFSTYVAAFIMLAVFLLVISSTPVLSQTEDASSGDVPVNGMLSDSSLSSKANGMDRLLADTGGAAKISVNRVTGVADFVSFPAGKQLSLTRSGSATAEANAFFTRYGDVFGIADARRELTLVKQRVDDLGMTHLTYQQVYSGVNVFAGRIDVHVGKGNRITAVNGTFIPKINLRAVPDLSAADAAAIAVDTVLAQNSASASITLPYTELRDNMSVDLTAVNSELYVFQVGLLQGAPGQAHLVYDVEVANSTMSIREFVFVDAHTGRVVDQITGVESGLNINVYNGGYGPGFLTWSTGDPYPYVGATPQETTDINNLIDGTTESYNHFFNAFGVDSYDWMGHVMETVNNDPSISCPNANWNGTSTNYCTDVTGDDTVAHEWGHAYTEYTSNLIYQWQSGALNESFSDIWGEVVDLLNGRGTDTPGGLRSDGSCSIYGAGAPSVDNSYRWLSGEDDPAFGGAIRDMWAPTCYGDPGKVSDNEYWCSTVDGGGVHTNSGVPNHAFALMVDGGNYNGFTINGLGLTKAAHIHWRAQSVYEGPATNFAGHADALEQSCTDLIGVNLDGLSTGAPVGPSGEIITVADCAEVATINDAVEFRVEPTQCGFTTLLDPNAPALCEGFGAVETIALEDWESGALPAGWTVGTHDVANPATFDTPDWHVADMLPSGANGTYAAFVEDLIIGDCAADDESGALFLDSPIITVPATSEVPRVAFDHWVATEAGWDGGNVKISVNGGPWTLLPSSAFEFNAYNSSLNSAGAGNTNPLAGEDAFTGTDGGQVSGSWGQSQVNLFGIAAPGDAVQFRFDFGVDGCNGVVGWYVDDFQVYSCELENPGANCGNSMIDPGETCDDGNTNGGDGCSNVCLVEEGWTCTGPIPGDPNGTNAVGDWSFEAGGVGNPYWTPSSTFTGIPGFPICDAANCAGVDLALTGDWYVWIGGISAGVTSSVEQSVVIPSTATELTLWSLRGVCDDPSDTLHVSLDGTDIGTVVCDGTDGAYVQQTFSVAGFNDDAAHDLFIGGTVGGTNGTHTNFFVDDVTIYDNIPTDPTPSVCTEIVAVCGDGILDEGETCDDGNALPGDGCSDTCQVEDGWTCTEPTPGGNAVSNGDFESGPVDWTESSTGGWDLIGQWGLPNSGTWHTWLGGTSVYEEAYIEQNLTIPATATMLDFALLVGVCGDAADYMDVQIDGTTIWNYPCTDAPGVYEVESVDVSAYADGASHLLTFYSESGFGGTNSNFFLDDVFIELPSMPSECTPLATEFACNTGAEGFYAGIPGDWTVVDNEGLGVIWTDVAGSGEAGNYTGGGGDAASVSSDLFGLAAFDTELWSPPFSLANATAASLDYLANYQNYLNLDFLEVDISSDGGATWTNLLSWNEDHGTFRNVPGEAVSIDLSAYLGMDNLTLRWRYYDPNGGSDWDWYAQIDDVALNCELPSTLVCNADPVNFDSGIPAEWSVVDNEGLGVVWTDIATSGEAGNFTGGGGDAASVSSDLFGPAAFDTELVSDPFDLPADQVPTLNYLVNYQNYLNLDFLDVDISSDGGATWTNLLSWNEDHGGFRTTPGEAVAIDLSAYAGMNDLLLRWHYYDPNAGNDWDWYAQVDDVGISCESAAAPIIDVDPESMASTLPPNDSDTQVLSISNLGDADLNWYIEEAEGGMLVPTSPENYAGASDSAAKAAQEGLVTIGDFDLSARGTGAGERVSPGVSDTPDVLTTITHSLSQDVVQFNSVACWDGVSSHADNSYIRVFDLAAFGITNDFAVTEVEFGIESATSGSGAGQPVDVNLYTLIDPMAPLTFSNMALIGSTSTTVADQDLTHITVPVAGVALSGSVLVVEVYTPESATDLLFIGSNPDGQTAPSYLASVACGLPEPLDTAAIGFPDMHIVMNVTGDTELPEPEGCDAPTDLPWLSVSPDAGTTSPAGTTNVDVTFDSTGLVAGLYKGTLCVHSDDPVTPLVEVPVSLTVEEAAAMLYLSANSNGVAGGVVYADEDIVAYDSATGWSMYFDGSDVGVKSTDVDALHLMDDGSILMSFEQKINIAGFGKVQPQDIVRFIPTSLGEDTAGSFEMYFNGSDFGLKKYGEGVDAIAFTPDGRLVVSTLAALKVPQTGGGALRASDDDLIVLNATDDWEMYLDGSDVWHYTEDVWGSWIDAATGDIYLSMQNEFTAGPVSGDQLDVFICQPDSLGADSACTFSMYFDGSEANFSGNRIDGFAIGE